MKKAQWVLLTVLFFCQISFAQQRGVHVGNNGVGGNLSFQNNEGSLIPIGAQTDTKGNPFLLDNWTVGKVFLKSGVNYVDSAFNFSLFDERLYFIKKEKLFSVTEPIATFILFDKTGANLENPYTNYEFAAGYPPTKQTNAASFFQILNKGKNYELLKWQHKKVRESYNYGGKVETEYVSQLAYYIFDKKLDKMFLIGNKPNTEQIKNTLSIEASIWKAYLEKNASNLKTEQMMQEFVAYLNAL